MLSTPRSPWQRAYVERVIGTIRQDRVIVFNEGSLFRQVTASDRKRDAYLYIRQSTIRQVFENTESTRRQYALRERAVALGWPPDKIIVIDTDLGQSGASAADREWFQRLVTEVRMGRAGIVLELKVSRLARRFWLECAARFRGANLVSSSNCAGSCCPA